MYCQMKWTILLSLFTLSNAFEQDHYTVVGGVLARSNSFMCPTGALVIPDNVRGVEITSIGSGVHGVFVRCTELTSVDLSATKVTTIGAEAFMETGLTSVTFPAELTTIHGGAFVNTGLTSVDLSATKTNEIGSYAFAFTFGLTSVTFPSSLTTIHEMAFSNTGLTSVTFPSSLTTIGSNAFAGLSLSLESVKYTGVKPEGFATNLPTCTDQCTETFCNNLGTVDNGACVCDDVAKNDNGACVLWTAEALVEVYRKIKCSS